MSLWILSFSFALVVGLGAAPSHGDILDFEDALGPVPPTGSVSAVSPVSIGGVEFKLGFGNGLQPGFERRQCTLSFGLARTPATRIRCDPGQHHRRDRKRTVHCRVGAGRRRGGAVCNRCCELLQPRRVLGPRVGEFPSGHLACSSLRHDHGRRRLHPDVLIRHRDAPGTGRPRRRVVRRAPPHPCPGLGRDGECGDDRGCLSGNSRTSAIDLPASVGLISSPRAGRLTPLFTRRRKPERLLRKQET